MKAVYSPCVEPLQYMFRGKQKELAPDDFTLLEDNEARFVIGKYAKFGVRYLARKMKGKKQAVDENAIKEAKAVWKTGNRAWAEEVVTDFHKSTKDQREAGVKVEEPAMVKAAKKFLGIASILLLLLLPAASWAQDSGQHKSGNFTYLYDLDDNTYQYCVTNGAVDGPFGQAFSGPGTIETAGSSVTVTGVNAADDVFAFVGVGDVIYVNGLQRIVVTNADNDTITVETAITLTGNVWSYKTLSCGTGATAGWAPVAGYTIMQFTVQFDQGDIDTLDVVWECKEDALGSGAVQVYPGPSSDCGFGTLSTNLCQFATEGDRLAVKIPHNVFTSCRIGIKYGTTDASDAGANIEQITATISVGR